ncbi:MAG: hypothetical protein ACT4TC_07325 [Myxococcaceae bacterium]
MSGVDRLCVLTKNPSLYRLTPAALFSENGGWFQVMQFPPTVGATFAAGGVSGAVYRWTQHYERFSLRGRTYEDCFELSYTGGASVICRDVGGVLSSYRAFGFDTRYELESTNF